ncbi:MAG: LysM peptidoglycan-binding domain-containing protein, partial [Treponema sp.]|nr:LysM peptidoglycan-binding domain-containing protein [Treponema sp.]
MKRRIIIGLILVCFLGTPLLFAQYNTELPEPVYNEAASVEVPLFSGSAGLWLPNFEEVAFYLWNFDIIDYQTMEFLPFAYLAQASQSDAGIPSDLRNNRWYIESVRLTNLALAAYEEGNYDASTQYAHEAIRFAELSDEYVRLQLKIREADNAIAAAQARLNWASSSSVNAAIRFPSEYNIAQTAFFEANNFRNAENWDDAISAAERVINALAFVTDSSGITPPVQQPGPGVYNLPAQYTVQPWAISKDCLWNIAGRAWVYNDPTQWRLLYNANRARLPQPDNPDLIHPGMVLDIPSIGGEVREGMYDASRAYV